MEEREIMKRKIISVLLTACLSISLLAGCGGNASKTDDSQVKEESSDTASQTTDTVQNEDPEVTITVLTRYAGSDVQAQWLQTMMEKFSELHPNVTFQDDSVADEAAYNNKLKTAIATGNLPNMWMQYGAASLVEYAKNGLVMDLSSLLEDTEFTSGLADPTLSSYDLSGYGVDGIYALPFAMQPEVIFYNKDLFAQAGINEVPETMEDLFAAFDKLNAAGITPMGMGAKDTWRLGHFYNCIAYKKVGVDNIKKIGAREAKWTDENMVETFEILKSFKDRGAFEENFEGIDWSTENANFLSGKYAMICVPLWFIPNAEASEIADSLDFFPIPYFEDAEDYKDNAAVYTDAHVYNGKLEGYEKEITLEWAKFTHSAYSEEVRLKVCNQLPGRSDVNIDGYEMSPLMKKALALNNELTTYGGDVFEYDEITSMQDVIRNSLVGMMLGTTPEDTAKTIQAEIDNNQ